MARARKCDCGTCKRCRRREYMRVWYLKPENRAKKREAERARRARKGDEIRALDRARGYRPADPEKRRARKRVRTAIENGTLVRQPCEVCGGKNVHAHHDDYSKPLSVRWLCPRHHGEAHRRALPCDPGDVGYNPREAAA